MLRKAGVASDLVDLLGLVEEVLDAGVKDASEGLRVEADPKHKEQQGGEGENLSQIEVQEM